MSAEARREQLIDAAVEVFAHYGYARGTTEEIASKAGVSQPYVVRTFGSKKKLFLAALEKTLNEITGTFTRPLPAGADRHQVGRPYVSMAQETAYGRFLTWALMLGDDPDIAATCRAGLAEIYCVLRTNARFDAETAKEFIATGLLINALVTTRILENLDEHAELHELVATTLGSNLNIVTGAGKDSQGGVGEG
ncbi:TetR/AcrR family transcriptional regulator [Haematomicrobium sanguinis]|uniref:TetR/AcrR family transcriptional regulator n=1 Tax=Haematomicrobium sanguinis TaxID=479106 RepID=UPI000478CE47|nr:TetR/AcrR family transcriptional regulator [Haematomicrobium sanguinis]